MLLPDSLLPHGPTVVSVYFLIFIVFASANHSAEMKQTLGAHGTKSAGRQKMAGRFFSELF